MAFHSTSSSFSIDVMRCIAHIDMDCFYAQVEALRLGVDCRVTPLALSQWGSLIAVNYPARARGVKRFNNVFEARALCPELIVALSPSYRMGESVSQYHPNPNQESYKISLEPYRHASRQIFSILASTPGVQVEKGSVDEAYMDVTEAARWELAEVRAAAAGALLDPLADVMEPTTRLIEDRRAEMEAWLGARGASLAAVFDEPMRALLRGECGAELEGSRGFCIGVDDATYAERCLLLCAASRVVYRLRQRIYSELHYDCSAGIAHNRVLAKCISARHKPNQQTLVLPDRSASALFDLPLSGLRGFGGKFGAAVSAVCGGVTECREAWLVPLAQLRKLDGVCRVGDDGDAEGGGGEGASRRLGRKRARNTSASLEGDREGLIAHSTSQYTFYRVRGLAEDTISNRPLSKTIIASKNFGRMTTSVEVVRRWMIVLASELCSRYDEFTALYHVKGRSFNIKLGNDGFRSTSGLLNHTVLLPEAMQPDVLAAVAMREVQAVLGNTPGAAADSVTLTIGGFVSSGSGTMVSASSLTAIARSGLTTSKEGSVRRQSRQQTLLSSFFTASTAGRAAAAGRDGCIILGQSGDVVARVPSSEGNGLDDARSDDSVHVEDDAVMLSLCSSSLDSNAESMSSVVLVNQAPPFVEGDGVSGICSVAEVSGPDVCETSPLEEAAAPPPHALPLDPLLPIGKAASEGSRGGGYSVTKHHEGHQHHLRGHCHGVSQSLLASAHAQTISLSSPSSHAPVRTIEVIEDNDVEEESDGVVTIID